MAAGLTIVGVFAILSSAMALWALWTTDPLKSIGGLVPFVSLLLILRVWRSLGWEMDGTWWGLALLAVTVVAVHVRDHAILELILSPSWAIFLPPHSLVALSYTAGAVLLFGGPRLLRAARFPVVLTWLVNPVPNFFTIHVDLPLQHVSSAIARGFAQALGQRLSPDQLRLMFTPQFGMFIAPGCNGIRGAVTMGFLALLAAYLYRFRPRVAVLVVAAAVLLGYVFNLVRLCCLVLYYLAALHYPWLQSRAETGDYLIGACLFFAAAVLLFTLILRLNPVGTLRPPALQREPAETVPATFLPRWSAFALLVALGSVSYARALSAPHAGSISTAGAAGVFPKRVGPFRLQRQWDEYMPAGGPLIYHWADYVPAVAGAGPEIPGAVEQAALAAAAAGDPALSRRLELDPGVVSVGVSPVLGAHDTLLCHAARGEDWLWHGSLQLATLGAAGSFSASLFNSGGTQYLEATTLCTGAVCGQYSTSRAHFGFVYSRPDTRTVLSQSPTRPIPILLRTSTLDTAQATDAARAELTGNLIRFLQAANLATFSKPYRDE